ncbi:MAG: hypothetical protein H6656_16350 [Ardenticatenaceae bacterium]|nr:hypothetical protein [Ardenticatenaceae bacterium]
MKNETQTTQKSMLLERLRRHESWWVLLLFVLLTAVAARNIVANLNEVIVGGDIDTYINPWADWWTQQVLTNPELSLWQTDMMYFPVGADLTYHSFSHLNTAVSLALRPLLGTLPAYNITILLNYVLAGLSMFHLGRYMTKSSIAGILAGLVFAFNSHNLYQSGHPVLLSIWCFPWITLFFIRAVRENSVRLVLVAAVFVFLGAAASTTLIILMVFWLAFLLLFMLFSSQFPRPSARVVLIFGLASGLLILPTVFPLLADAVVGGNTSFFSSSEASINIDIISPIVPHWYAWLIRSMYVGIMPFFLAMLAVGRQRKQAALWLLLTIVAYLFAIGPEPKLANTGLGFVLPWTLPIVPFLRQMYRMTILISLGIAMLAAYGWLGFKQSLQNMSGGRQVGVAFLVGLAIFVDYTAVPFPSTTPAVSTFYTDYLDNVPPDVALAIVPTGRQEDKQYVYFQTLHEHPITAGHVSRAGDEMFEFILENPLLRAGAVDFEPAPLPADPAPALQQLAEANIGFLVIHKTVMIDEEIWRDYLPLTPVFEDDLVLVYSTGLLDDSLPDE